MTLSADMPSAGTAAPAVPLSRLIAVALGAGACATAAFDLYGQAFSPLMGAASLAPVPLATQTWATLTGSATPAMGHLLHYIAGLIAYPLGWLILRALLPRLLPGLPRPALLTLGVLGYGVALWVFAIWFMASVINGNPPFLGFTGITWVALAGHVLFAAVFAAVAEPFLRRG